ncbi:MAG TPA: AbrB/MazE/SpoVT family DNA-binding domain-containing protein [Thermodesulfovibrionia bacterium]|nr:AbrB/MazE/SpoVT family DNA-binding domain-containing protein [Thermodesulfovibrionia bacterium]
MEYAIAKVSTKGQIVIPNSLRREIQTGDEFLIVKDEKRIILKNVKDMAKDLKEDLVFAKRVEKAWQDYDKGKFVTKSKDAFLKELRAC